MAADRGLKVEIKTLKLELLDIELRYKMQIDIIEAKHKAKENTELKIKTEQLNVMRAIMQERF